MRLPKWNIAVILGIIYTAAAQKKTELRRLESKPRPKTGNGTLME
jgi:hypothetical protein